MTKNTGELPLEKRYSIEKVMIEPEVSNGKIFVVDGTNICAPNADNDSKPMLSNLHSLLSSLKKKGIQKDHIKIFCDVSLRNTIDDLEGYKQLIADKIIYETPVGKKAIEFILEYCNLNENAFFISNELTDEYNAWFPSKEGLEIRRITALRVNDTYLLRPIDENIRF